MKKIALFLFIAALAASSVIAQEKGQTAQIEKTFISVSGMNCDMCKAKVEKGLRGAAGVSKAEVSLDKGMAYVEFSADKTSLGKLEAVILSLGYGANDKKPEKSHMEMEHPEGMGENQEHKATMVTLIGDGEMQYACPMEECMVFSSVPDVPCPVCGMKLRKMEEKDYTRMKELQKSHKVQKIKKQ